MLVVATSPFEIIVDPLPDGAVRVSLIGEFDMGVGDRLSAMLTAAARRPGSTAMIVDLQRTDLLDSHGIQGLVAGYEAATQAGRRFTVINARGLVQQVLDITGLAEVLIDRRYPWPPADLAS